MRGPEKPRWRKSSYSNGVEDACVEVANDGPRVRIRDSKDVFMPSVCIAAGPWSEFLSAVTDGPR